MSEKTRKRKLARARKMLREFQRKRAAALSSGGEEETNNRNNSSLADGCSPPEVAPKELAAPDPEPDENISSRSCNTANNGDCAHVSEETALQAPQNMTDDAQHTDHDFDTMSSRSSSPGSSVVTVIRVDTSFEASKDMTADAQHADNEVDSISCQSWSSTSSDPTVILDDTTSFEYSPDGHRVEITLSYIKDLENRCQELCIALESSKVTNTELSDKIEHLKKENQQLLDLRENDRKQFEYLFAKEKGCLRQQLEVHIQTIGILINEKSYLRSTLFDIKNDLRERTGELEDSIYYLKAAEERVEELEDALSTVSEEKEILDKSKKDLMDKRDELLLEIVKQSTQNERLAKKVSELEEELFLVTEEKLTIEDHLETLQREVDLLEHKIKQQSSPSDPSESSDQKEQVERETEQLELAPDKDSLTSQSTLWKEQVDQLSGEVQTLKEEKAQAFSRIQELEACLATLQNERAVPEPTELSKEQELQVEVDSLRVLLPHESQVDDTLTYEYEQGEQRPRDLEHTAQKSNDHGGARAQILDRTEDDQSTLTHNQELKSQLAEMQEACVRLTKEKLDLTCSVQAEIHNKNQLLKELEQLNANLGEMKSMVEVKEQEAERLQEQRDLFYGHLQQHMAAYQQILVVHQHLVSEVLPRLYGELQHSQELLKYSQEENLQLHSQLSRLLALHTEGQSVAVYPTQRALPRDHHRAEEECSSHLAQKKEQTMVSETLVQRNGDFLIRDSLTSLGDYVLTCRWRNQALHFKINKVVVKAGDSYTHIQYLFEQESFDHVPALVCYHVGSRKAVSEQSGAIIYCPVNLTFPLRYLEASYGLSQGSGKAASPASPSGPKGSHMKRRSVTMTDGLTTDKLTRGDSCPTSTSLPHPRESIRNCALSMDQIPDLHSPMSPISESPSSPAYSTVTRIHAAPAAPSATALPASPVARRSSEPQLCSGSAPKPLGDLDKGSHASPSHSLCKASPSPSLSSYSDPDSGHYCQLQPPIRGSREWAAAEASSRQTRSYGEKLKELSENGAPEGDWGRTFHSLLIPKDNRPLEVGLLRKVKELLAEVDARTLARHVTKVDCLVARILGVTKEMQTLMGVRWGMELLTLPHGRQLRLDLLERFHTMSIMLAVDILGCTGSAEERAALLHKTIQLAAELRGTMGNMFSFAAVMGALDMVQITRLEQTWVTLRQRHTEGAILYEKKLKPFLKSLNEGKEGPPLSNTTFPHIVPLITLLECDSAPAEGPEPWGSTEHGVEVVLAHLEAARTVAHHGGLYHTNAEVKLQGFQARPELLEIFSTEFQMRLLWGSQGASSSQSRRYEKFDKVLSALSHKLEPAVRSSEL